MLVSQASKLAFVHVQKTGGRSVNKVLRNNFSDLVKLGRRHIHFDEAATLLPDIADYFVFGFVRNPWARLVSWYAMVAAAHETPRHVAHLQENTFWQSVRADFDDFDDFIRRGVGDPSFRPKRYGLLRVPQTRYFSDGSGRFRADFVGRTEHLDEDLVTVMAKFDVHVDVVPRINASSHTHYTGYYTPATRDIVARVYADDLERFGYHY